MTAALCVFFVVAIAWSIRRLPPFHPIQLWTASLGLAVVAHSLRLLPYRPLHVVTVLILAGATAAFAVGAVAGASRAGALRRLASSPPDEVMKIAAAAALALTGLMLVAFLAQVASLHGIRRALIISSDVRVAIYEGETFVTIKYLYPAFASVALCAIVAGRSSATKGRRRWLALAGVAVSSTYFSTGRANVITAVAIGVVAYGLTRPEHVTRVKLAVAGAAGLVAAVLLVLALGQVIGKTFEEYDISSVRSPFSDSTLLAPLAMPYHSVAAPVGALDRQVALTDTWGRAAGCATLALACRVLEEAGLSLEPEPGIRAFTGEPMPWNTYTALDVPLIDGGFALVLPIVGLLGLVTGLLWGPARQEGTAGVLIYALWAPAAVWAGTINHFFAPHLLGATLVASVCVAGAAAIRSRALRWRAAAGLTGG